MTDEPVVVDGESLTPDAVERVARHGATVRIPEEARERVRESRERIVDIVESGQAVYGVNTGFGELVQERIPEDDIETLQQNLVRSHAAGTGRKLDQDEVRAMLVTRLNALVKGYSGVRERIVDVLAGMINEGVHPVVKAKGSLGASGDLAPLAHLALVVTGEGEATVEGERLPGGKALKRKNLEPATLHAKEGLGLINGTQLTVGLASLVVCDAERAMRAADIAGAMTTEATMSTTASSHPSIQRVRPHQGQTESAENVRRLTQNSEIVESHRNCDRVQDAYSLRCLPQVHGAVRDSIQHLREAVETELNSATDNPLVFPADDADDRASGTERAAVLSGGNFHGQPLALRLDYVTSGLAELASISERRMDRMLNPNVQEEHLPPFLTEGSGLRSGYMIAQYTAADLVSTNRSQGRPSMDSIPVSGNQEDHVSMSAQSAHIASETVNSTLRVVGIELACAAQALDFIEDCCPGLGTHAAYHTIREHVPHLNEDRPIHRDITSMLAILRSDTLFDAVETALDEPLS
ncbi:histidine ammonia-lyase (plasmid) [Haloterrigena turkmenica DSM 5511]|uniref:Probable histidine ammonia-lyase n=1 Tax=Haloterrigena turkmenica (strain ATCC 51198 / DSM 5511 / JCM 9101 / NCIMB 13204 / VKM B-1734 / 4k) TaxID=543526 RepID=D2S0I3_HALTV|nr:histidine ammonia-lyase [Haloterrigena turkmenica]ADB62880.1 histidine ammonia-lyase [Haloterrigena turkmenica DSM 5511]